MGADLNFTMELDLLESLEEPTLPLVLVDSLGVAKAPGDSALAVVIAADAGAAFVAGGRMVRTTPPCPPPRRVARGTVPNAPLVGAPAAKR